MNQVTQNQKALINESFLNMSNSQIESNIRTDQIKKLKKKEALLKDKLNEIKLQVSRVIDEEKKINRKNNIKEFIDKYEHDRNEMFIDKVHHFEEQSNLLKQKRMNDLNKSTERRIKKIEEIEQNEKERKAKFLQDQRLKELAIMRRRKKENDEQMKVYKVNNFKPKEISSYLYFKMKDQYITETNRHYEKAKVLQKGQLVTKEEIGDLRKKIKERKLALEKEAIDKTHMMKEMWKNRSLVIPTYKSPILNILKEEEIKQKEQNEIEKTKNVLKAKERALYCKERVPKPKFNPKIRREREERIFRMNKTEKTRVKIIRQELARVRARVKEKQLESRNRMKKLKKSKSAIDINENKYISTIENILSKKSKRIQIPPIKRKVVPPKSIDYLSELRKQKKIHPINYNWNKILDTKGNKIQNLQVIKNKIDAIDEKVRLQKEFMRLNGGYEKNPDIGENIGNMIIDSIKGKLIIINTLKGNGEV